MRKNECILYIDDAPENLNSFKSVYRYHYNVLLASSAKEGLKLLQSNSVKVLLVDQRMPKITGSQFIEQVAQTYPDILKIMVTGYADIEAVGACIIAYPHSTMLPVPLVNGKHIVYTKPDLSDLQDLCAYYVEHKDERQMIASSARDYFDKYLHRSQLACYYLKQIISCISR